ncbi:MAG: hypothetical protein JSV32_00270, partial [Dehalococcoidia bacterium]
AVEYGEMAAQRAMDVYDYGEAARLIQQAIRVQEVFDPDDKEKKCDLLLELSEILVHIPDTKRVHEIEAPEIYSLAKSIGDDSRTAQACIVALHALTREMAGASSATPQYIKWAERADQYAKPNTVERAGADFALARIKLSSGRNTQAARNELKQASDLAKDVGAGDVIAGTGIWLIAFTGLQDFEESVKSAENFISELKALKTTLIDRSVALYYIASILLSAGQRERAEELFDEIQTLAERSGQYFEQYWVEVMEILFNIMDGKLEEALDLSEKTLVRGSEEGVERAVRVSIDPYRIRIRTYLGITDENIKDIVESVDIKLNPRAITIPCLCWAYLGQEEASTIISQNILNISSFDELGVYQLAMYLEASVVSGHRKAAELLLDSLQISGWYINSVCPTCIPRHLGGAAVLLEKYEEAREHYKEAIKVCTEMPFRPELALSRLQLAELLLDHYPDEKAEAIKHLDFSIREFREMKMQPSLERALRRKNILKA